MKNRNALYEEALAEQLPLSKQVSFYLLKAEGDPVEGVVEAIVSVFDVEDSYGDVVKQGSFKKSLKNGKTKAVCWMHRMADLCGRVEDAKELSPGNALLPEEIKAQGGLWVKLRFNLKVQRGKEAYEHIVAGDITEFSIGYYLIKWETIVDEKSGKTTYNLLEIDLVEVSPVIRGACPNTTPTAIKSEAQTMDEQISAALAAVEAVCDRQAKILAMPERKERGLSDQRKADLRELAGKLVQLEEKEAPAETPAVKPKTLSYLDLQMIRNRSKRK